MARMVSRMVRWMSRSAWVVTSPMTTQRPFVIAVSHATRARASCSSMPSSTASETWSQILSGWPSVTDSEVSRKEREELKDVVTTTANNIEIGAGKLRPASRDSRDYPKCWGPETLVSRDYRKVWGPETLVSRDYPECWAPKPLLVATIQSVGARKPLLVATIRS